MNGWQRLFVLFSVIVYLFAGVVALLNLPTEPSDGEWGVYSCGLNEWRVDATRATFLLSSVDNLAKAKRHPGEKPSAECYVELEQISLGQKLNAEVSDHLVAMAWGALGIGVLLASVYAFGAALGWVWRGFFPRKPQV